VFSAEEEEKKRSTGKILCLVLEPEDVAKFVLKGDPTVVSGSHSHHMFFAEGAEGKLGVKERDCACNPCMDWLFPRCQMSEYTVSTHKDFPVVATKGWAEVHMDLKQETGIAAGGRKRKRGASDGGWKIKEQQLQQALEPAAGAPP
jgi:hypothetical protein